MLTSAMFRAFVTDPAIIQRPMVAIACKPAYTTACTFFLAATMAIVRRRAEIAGYLVNSHSVSISLLPVFTILLTTLAVYDIFTLDSLISTEA